MRAHKIKYIYLNIYILEFYARMFRRMGSVSK